MNYNNFLSIAIIALIVFFSGNAQSHSKTKHATITRTAVHLLSVCNLDKNNAVSNHVETLVKFNLKQDNLFKKLILWHFPDPIYQQPAPENVAFYGMFVLDRTFNRYFKYLEQQVSGEHEFSVSAPGIGAMLHYVQDMSVPAHVRPIFHPVGFKSDKFDSWHDFNYLRGRKEQIIALDFKGLCDSITPKLQPYNLLIAQQQQTLLAADTSIAANQYCIVNDSGVCIKAQEPLPWATFWPSNIKENGFGNYGCRDKSKGFGHRNVVCNNTKYRINVDSYKEFALKNVKTAVIASANLMLSFNELPRVTRDDTCPQAQWVASKRLLKCLAQHQP